MEALLMLGQANAKRQRKAELGEGKCELLWRGSRAKGKLEPKPPFFGCSEDTAGSLFCHCAWVQGTAGD